MTAAHVMLSTQCAHCRAAVELECEGFQGFWGYRTYNEYFCPRCRKQNFQLSTGAVVSARLAAEIPVASHAAVASDRR